MPIAPRSLVRRVAWATCLAVAGSAAAVALVTALLADRFARAREQAHLVDAARTLALELSEPDADARYLAVDEARELAHTGIRVAIHDGRGFVAGDRAIPSPGRDRCLGAEDLHVCSVSAGPLVAVMARDGRPLREQREAMALACLLAVALTSIVGALLARRIARLLVAPLSRLGGAVARVGDDAPDEGDLGEDEGVAEVDALRAALRATLTRLGQALAASRRFAADAAHELRTPLTTIIGELSLAETASADDATESRARAKRTATRLATLVDRLLVLATPASKLAVTERVELLDVVEDTVELVPTGAWPRVTIDVASPAVVEGDRALLTAMVANAIENGLKFSEGAVTVTIRFVGATCEVAIADDGPGIPERERGQVFEPFFRTRATRASGVPGHGIGLSLIAHVAAVHGGRASFAETVRGTRLVITLPRATDAPQPGAA